MWWKSADDTTFLDECEAMLEGRGAEFHHDRGERVPAWAWINLLAHGTEADLRMVASERVASGDWQEARGYLAEELVCLIDAGLADLDRLQRDVLVPMELEAMREDTTSLARPPQIVVRVLAALDAHRTRPFS